MPAFEAQPEGPGPVSLGTALHFAYVRQVHRAQCALFREKTAAGAGLEIVLTGPKT